MLPDFRRDIDGYREFDIKGLGTDTLDAFFGNLPEAARQLLLQQSLPAFDREVIVTIGFRSKTAIPERARVVGRGLQCSIKEA